MKQSLGEKKVENRKRPFCAFQILFSVFSLKLYLFEEKMHFEEAILKQKLLFISIELIQNRVYLKLAPC